MPGIYNEKQHLFVVAEIGVCIILMICFVVDVESLQFMTTPGSTAPTAAPDAEIIDLEKGALGSFVFMNLCCACV